VRNHSSLVRAVANYGIHYGWCSLFLGHNGLFSARRYYFGVLDMCSCNTNIKRVVYNRVNTSIDDSQWQTAGFVNELVIIRDHMLELSGEFDFSRDELEQLVEVVCTYYFLHIYVLVYFYLISVINILFYSFYK